MSDHKEKSISELQQLAEQGDAQAQFQLGEHYELKVKNVPEACKWYEKAAKQGHTRSQYFLGYIYHFGDTGFPPNREKALYWYGKAAEKGHTESERGMGDIFRCDYNFIEACKWYKKASEKKDAYSMYYLAMLNERKSRENPDADVHLALKLYEELSNEPFKHKGAMIRLGLLYCDDRFIQHNPKRGKELFEKCNLIVDYKVKLFDGISIYDLWLVGAAYCSGQVNEDNEPNIDDMNKGIKLVDVVIQDGFKGFPPDRLDMAKNRRAFTDKHRKYLINRLSGETIYQFEGNMNDISNIKFIKTTNLSIEGKWEWMNVCYEFFNDDTYIYKNTESGLRTNGNYAISGNVITFFMGSVAKSEFSLQGDRLTLTIISPERGSTFTFKRVY